MTPGEHRSILSIVLIIVTCASLCIWGITLSKQIMETRCSCECNESENIK